MTSPFETNPHGLLLGRDAIDLGMEGAIRSGLRSGDLSRVRSGVYRVNRADRREPYPAERYREVVRAAGLKLHAPVFTAYSAAALLGLPIVTRWPDSVYLSSRTNHGHRRRGLIEVGRIGDDEPVQIDGMLMSSIEMTLIHLGRLAPLRDALAATDAALRSPRHRSHPPALTTLAGLVAVHDRLRPYRGCRRVEAVLARATHLSDSVLETESRLLFEEYGYAEPRLQHRIPLPEIGSTARLDFYWSEADAAAEADGRGKYRSGTIRASADSVIAEKDRENAIRRRVRAFDRWDWADCRARVPVLQRLDAMGIPRTRRPLTLHLR
jgi:hypothetical protein